METLKAEVLVLDMILVDLLQKIDGGDLLDVVDAALATDLQVKNILTELIKCLDRCRDESIYTIT